MSPSVTEDDIDKLVETATGEPIGTVADVEGETAYVDLDPDVSDSTRAALDWGEAAGDALPLASAAVAEITDDAVQLGDEYSGTHDEMGEMDEAESGERARTDEQREADRSPREPAEDVDEVETDVGGAQNYRQDETDVERDDPTTGGAGERNGTGRQDETDPDPEDLDETDPELDDVDGGDPGVEGSTEDAGLTDAAAEIDGDRERRADPASDPLTEAGGDTATGDSPATESGTREDVDVDPTEVMDDPDAEIDAEEDVGQRTESRADREADRGESDET